MLAADAAIAVVSGFGEPAKVPFGVSTGAETPREITVSILAEIIGVQRGRE